MSRFYPNAQGTLTPKVSTWMPRLLSLLSKTRLGTNSLGDIVDTSAIDYYDATIGTGGDYATVKLALEASKTKLKLLSNVSETVGYSNVNNVTINLNGYTWTLGNYRFSFGGYFNLTNGTVSYAVSTGVSNYDGNPSIVITSNSIVSFYNLTITSSSTIANTFASTSQTANVVMNFEKIKFNPSNNSCSLFYNYYNGTSTDLISVRDIIITGSGSSCELFFYYSPLIKITIDTILITGTVKTNGNIVGITTITNPVPGISFYNMIIPSATLIITGYIYNCYAPNCTYSAYYNYYITDSYVSGIANQGNSAPYIIKATQVTFSGSSLNSNYGGVNMYCENCTFNVAVTFYGLLGDNGGAFYSFSNCKFIGGFTMNSTGIALFSNCQTTTLTASSNNVSVSNIYTSSNVVIGGDNCSLTSPIIAGNLTINASADKTLIRDARVTGTFTDGGTNTTYNLL